MCFVFTIPASYGLTIHLRLAMGFCFIIFVIGSEVFWRRAGAYITKKKRTSKKLF